jgi:energy-coupling factor transport system permease protein
MIAGLFRLLWPVRRLGVDVSRVAGRIWLTLEYAEDADKWTRAQWHRLLEGELDDAQADQDARIIRVEAGRMSWRDAFALLALTLAMGGLALW